MKHFKRVRSGIDVRPFLAEIEAIPDVWGVSTGRQEKFAVQREAQSVTLRGLFRSGGDTRTGWDVHESRWSKISRRLPTARSFLALFAAEMSCELSRAKIVLLPGGGKVYPHFDRGEYYRVRDRYHLILRSTDGSFMKAGKEEVRMKEGELWWFNNKKMHEARNEGEGDRIHFIFDLLPRTMLGEVAARKTTEVSGKDDPPGNAEDGS